MPTPIDLFAFALPPERIAQHPCEPRDRSRLLVIGDKLEDRMIRDLPSLLRRGDLLVSNDTRVLPTRFAATVGASSVEVTLFQCLEQNRARARWRAFARPARKLAVGQVLTLGPQFTARVEAKGDGGQVTLLLEAPLDVAAALERDGAMPLPPYIRRDAPETSDRAAYQTVFARRPGAVAAPTAGLHFTPRLLRALQRAGIGRTRVTLHVGAGTFLPVRASVIEEHRMLPESGAVSAQAARRINETRARGSRVIAVGTTVLRVLEASKHGDKARAWSGETELFITPGYRVTAADLLLTNFHMPRSTLFMLACAFAGTERMQRAYAHAIQADYRFYSYGDATLLHPAALDGGPADRR